MSHEIEKLCDMLDDEIERQQNVSAVCEAQHKALCARDVEAIDARNNALELLALESGLEESERSALVAAISRRLDLVPERTRLSDLVSHAPDPWKSRLGERRSILCDLVLSNQRLVRRNQLIATKSKSIAEEWRDTLFGHLGEAGPAYCGQGHTSKRVQGGPAMIDQRG